MTGGNIVIIGKTGRNFGAGMSGGIAYVYDMEKNFKDRCNYEMIELQAVTDEDKDVIYSLLRNHVLYTSSRKGKLILENIDSEIKNFVKVMPLEFKRILEQKKLEAKMNLSEGND